MATLPSVKIIHDPTKDAEAFISFIWHKYFIQNREKILKTYPELENIVINPDAEKKVAEFVVLLHKDKTVQLKEIIKHNQDILDNMSDKAFIFLADYMDYSWPDAVQYTAYLSLLPFSPFKKGYFFYSVLGELNNKNQEYKSILSTAIHEISHMIFLEYLGEYGWKIGENVPKDVVYVLQETLTASMFKSPELLSLFKMSKPPRGNPEIAELRIIKEDKNITLIDFVDEFILFNRKNNKKMNEIIKELMDVFLLLADQLGEKMGIWRKLGYKILRDEEILDKFQTPIVVD